ncbi:MAG TPA: hypothetical protein VNS02_11180 [Rhizobiaceae bacterium]|nr:hypothetical protein [Rhizobiaceae bacterium]
MSENPPASAATMATRLSVALRDLHRALIRAEAGDDPAFQNPYTFLFAVLGDPRFSWTSPLSQLIVQIDEAVAQGELTDVEHIFPLRAAAEQLIGDAKDGDPEFRLRHLMALQKEPDVALATGALRRALAGLPKPAEPAGKGS